MRRVIDFYRLQIHVMRTWRPSGGSRVRRLLATLIISVLSLGGAVWIMPGVDLAPGAPVIGSLLVAALVLAALNALVRPLFLALFAGISVIAVAKAFLRLDGMEHVPDLSVISLYDPLFDEVAAFEELIGSHGGLGGPQTIPIIMHPAEWDLDEELVTAPAVYRQIRRSAERHLDLRFGKGGTADPLPMPEAAPTPARSS